MLRNRASFGCWLLMALAVTGGCQRPGGDTLDRLLIGEVMMHAELSANLRTLAVPGGRLTGTPNAERAQAFVADKLREYGLQNVHLEPFDVSCWTVRDTRVSVQSEPPRVLDGAVALARTRSTQSGGVTAELIDLGDPNEADFATRGSELRGRFVLVRDGGLRRGPLLRLACEHGAAGLVVMSRPDREPIIGNGHREPRPEPAVVIRHDQEIVDRLARGETVRLNIQLETENWECRPSNVVGEIPGCGPLAHEVVILCAHLDSWHLAEGAMDNGVGSAVILETARALSRVGWRPRRTVRFVWFMAEELGLLGSEAYARDHLGPLEKGTGSAPNASGDDQSASQGGTCPPFGRTQSNPPDHIVAVVNVDMPGSPRTFGLFGHPELELFVQSIRRDLAGYELDEKIAQWHWEGSDHTPFVAHGIPALSLGGDLGPGVKGYHTAGDTYDSVDRRGTIPSSAVLAVVVRRLADVEHWPGMQPALPPSN